MQQELKQRLIGASVIIALAIIFVPMLFESEPIDNSHRTISIAIPEEPESNLELKQFDLDRPVAQIENDAVEPLEVVTDSNQNNRLVPIEESGDGGNSSTQNETTHAGLSEDANSEPLEQPQTDESVNIEHTPPPDESADTQPVTENTVDSTAPEPAENSGDEAVAYRVKIGSFSQQSNAEKVKAQLAQNHVQSTVEFVPDKRLYRVWSQALYATEAQAQAHADQVAALKLNIGAPTVIQLAADAAADIDAQSDGAWVIQLGSFSQKDNAIDLRNKVRSQDFKCFVDLSNNSAGAVRYRVRVGPFMDKAAADAANIKIQSVLKLQGLVKSHELNRVVN